MPKLRPPAADKANREIVAKIKYGMEMAGVNNRELAMAARIDPATLYDRYNHPGNFRLSELRNICKKLRIPLANLIGESLNC